MKSIKPFKILASRVAQSTLDQGTTGPGCKEVILVHIPADMRCFCSSESDTIYGDSLYSAA